MDMVSCHRCGRRWHEGADLKSYKGEWYCAEHLPKEEAAILEQIKEPAPVGYKSPPREGQWKAGQSGNPGGRPKWRPLTEALQALLEEEPALNKELVKAWVVKAGRGDVSAANMLWDRLEGKVAQTIGGSTDTGPVKLVIEWEK